MALETAHLEDSSEFEPDSNFFDNFLDGMDVLIDNCRDPKHEESWTDGRTDEESVCSSGGDRMVIDLPSSPENDNTKEVKNVERSDIKDVLTNRVLAQLEKSSSHRRNKVKNSFPSTQLVVDVLDRLKKSVQQKAEPSPLSSSTGTTPHPEISKKNHSISVPETGDATLQIKLQGDILSNISSNPDEQNRKQNKTISQVFRCFFSENTSRYDHPQSGSSRGANDYEYKKLDLNKHKRKRRNRKKHKSSKSKSKDSKRRRHHKPKSKTKRVERDVQVAKTSDFSLESVSSADENDMLNKQHSEEEREPVNEEADDTGVAKSPKCREYVKQPDCEEGEVVSSSSDWESECVAKKRRGDLKPHQIRPECRNPSLTDRSWSRRFENRRTPPTPSWSGIRLRSEDYGRYLFRRTRSPVRMSPWREQPSDRQRLRIPIPRLGSLSPVPIPVSLRPRSPGDRLGSELPRPFVDSFGYPIEMLTSRRIDHLLPPFHRPRSPWEEVHESRHLFNSSVPMEIHTKDVPCPPPLRIERRFPKEPGFSERREKPGLLSRCLQEIRHRSYKPGRFRFVYDPESEVLNPPQRSCLIDRYSSPLYSSQLQTHALSFTSPNVRHIGTSGSSVEKALSAVSVGCQTQEEEILNITEKQVEKSTDLDHIEGSSIDLPVLSEINEKSLLTIRNPEKSCSIASRSAVSEVLEVTRTPKYIHSPPVQNNSERQDIIQEIVSRVSISKTTRYPTSSQGTLEMWKTIVSFRYPDLSEKEKEQVVLVKSMELDSKHGTGTA